MKNAALSGKPDAGNPHVRFDEGEVASAKPRHGSLLYKIKTVLTMMAVALGTMYAQASVPVPTVWFKADTGVTTNAAGRVTGWANQGSLGSDLDLSAQSQGAVLAEKAFGDCSAVRFAGDDYLQTAGTTALGLSNSSGATIITVYRATSGMMWQLDNAPGRFYLDYASGQSRSRFFYFWANKTGNTYYATGTDWTKHNLCTLTVASDGKMNGYFGGTQGVAASQRADNVFKDTVGAGTFSIGNGFSGDIAEFRVYNRELTASERVTLELELKARYGLVQPTVCYQADRGVTTNGDGKVTGWANQGSLGAGLDLTATGESDMTLTENAYGSHRPMVKFQGASYLQAANQTTLGLTTASGATIFTVYKIGTENTGYAPWKLKIDNSETCRFYCDYVPNQGRTRFMYFWNTQSPSGNQNWYSTGSDYRNSSLATFMVRSDKTMEGFLDGVRATPATGTQNKFAHEAKAGIFSLGTASFTGEIAEYRVYNKPLTSAERTAVEFELAAKYAKAITVGGTRFAADMLTGCERDVMAFGDDPNGSEAASAIPQGAQSGALKLGFETEAQSGANTIVCLGHGGEGLASDVWCVAASEAARQIPLRVTYVGADVDDDQLALYVREDPKTQGRVLAMLSRDSAGVLTAVLPTGWPSGNYSFSEIPRAKPAVWFRADQGVTVDSGRVTGWENFGSLKDSGFASVKASGEGDSVTVSASADFGGQPTVRFNGGTYLMTENGVTLGVVPSSGLTVFAVCRFADRSCSGLYSVTTPDARQWRFGIDMHKDGCVRNFLYSTAADWSRSVWSTDVPYVLSAMTYGAGTSPSFHGIFQDGLLDRGSNVPTFNSEQQGQRFCLGRTPDQSATFDGDLAELRIYTYAMTAAERASIESELSARYGLAVQAAGTQDGGALATHAVDGLVIGEDPAGGIAGAVAETWSDGVLTLALGAAGDEATKTLTYVGSDGGRGTFVKTGEMREEIERTWYVSSSAPSVGGTLTFACATDAAERKYQLYVKTNGASSFRRLSDAEAAVTEGSVTFALGEIGAGTYKLVSKPLNIGLSIILR